jgi:hypothetical protein
LKFKKHMKHFSFSFKKTALPLLLLQAIIVGLLFPSASYAQTCTANAGGAATVCGSTTTLTGSVSGTLGAGTPMWTFVSGPGPVPVIASPTSLNTNITGMTLDGVYTFNLSRACGTGTSNSTVAITAHPRPATFTAGPDVSGICATVGTTPLNGVIPAGFTGTWRSANVYQLTQNNTTNANSTFSSTTTGPTTFSLINKANHNQDPQYYAILAITSADGLCSYEDTAKVTFCPNPQINTNLNTTGCYTNAGGINLGVNPIFSTAGTHAGSTASGTTVTMNVISQPAGGNISYGGITGNGGLGIGGLTAAGTYTFTLTVTNCCGTYTTPTITITNSGASLHAFNFQPTGHGAPEQVGYNGSYLGEVHCTNYVGSTTPEDFYFDINALDDPTTITLTATQTGQFPPGGAVTSVVVTKLGGRNCRVTVTPPAGGWQIGTYRFDIGGTNPSGLCGTGARYYIHISDGSRPAVTVPDQAVCYTGTGAVSAFIPFPAKYVQVPNSSYMQDYSNRYDFTVVSKPAGSGTPTFDNTNLRDINLTGCNIYNLTMAGDYVFTMRPNGAGAGGVLVQAYACAGTSNIATFTIHVENKVTANAGSDQTATCKASNTLLGNVPGTGTAAWLVVSKPAGTTPVITSPGNPSTTVTGMSLPGVYSFSYAISSPYGGCSSKDTVTIDNSACVVVPVKISSFTATAAPGCTALLQWATATEISSSYYAIEYSTDGTHFTKAGTVSSHNNPAGSAYSYSFADLQKGTYYFRIKATDLDGSSDYSNVVPLKSACGNAVVVLSPNPAKDVVNVTGLTGNNTILLMDVAGRPLTKVSTANAAQQLSIAAYAPGTYIVRIVNNEGKITSIKLVKER